MMIEISIIIPVRNQKDSLLAALNNLRRQIKKPRLFEVVICDDNSDDGTGDAVKKLRYPIFLKYFVNNPPLGRAANRNLGFEKSVGKELVFIDGDMVPGDNFLEAMIGDGDLDSVKVGHAKPAPDEKATGLNRYLYSRGRYASTATGEMLPGKYFTSNNFFISRENFQKLDGFDTNFTGWGGEDIDFGLRLENANIAIKNAADAITYHYHKRSIKSLVDDYADFGRNSFDYLISKHPEFLRQIPGNVLGLAKSSNPLDLFYKLISIFAINSGSLGLAKAIIQSLPNFNWPDFIYDYILWGNLSLGYKRRVNRGGK
jgi:glycosyltransferase involved in cell wall biosynthesis